eukprot:RCo053136
MQDQARLAEGVLAVHQLEGQLQGLLQVEGAELSQRVEVLQLQAVLLVVLLLQHLHLPLPAVVDAHGDRVDLAQVGKHNVLLTRGEAQGLHQLQGLCRLQQVALDEAVKGLTVTGVELQAAAVAEDRRRRALQHLKALPSKKVHRRAVSACALVVEAVRRDFLGGVRPGRRHCAQPIAIPQQVKALLPLSALVEAAGGKVDVLDLPALCQGYHALPLRRRVPVGDQAMELQHVYGAAVLLCQEVGVGQQENILWGTLGKANQLVRDERGVLVPQLAQCGLHAGTEQGGLIGSRRGGGSHSQLAPQNPLNFFYTFGEKN